MALEFLDETPSGLRHTCTVFPLKGLLLLGVFYESVQRQILLPGLVLALEAARAAQVVQFDKKKKKKNRSVPLSLDPRAADKQPESNAKGM